MLRTQDEVVRAMTRRDMDESRALLGGHEIGRHQRRVMVIPLPRKGCAQTVPASSDPLSSRRSNGL